MGDLDTTTFLITGANTGIGRVTANELAARGAEVILAGRSQAKTQPVLDEIAGQGGKARFVALDLAELASVRRCAQQLLDEGVRLRGLINNAGMAGARGRSVDGFELTFATNHLGHYLLTRLLLPCLVAPARIVNVASQAHYGPKELRWEALTEPTRTRTGFPEYGVSKLCNVLFTKELARRLERQQVAAFAVHPGVVATDVWRQVPAPLRWVIKRFMLSPAQGARSTIVAATQQDLVEQSGAYLDWDCQPKPPSKLVDEALARELWSRSARWVGLPEE